MNKTHLILTLAALLAGCSDESEGTETPADDTSLEGLFHVVSITETPACTGEGVDVTDSYTNHYLQSFRGSVFGNDYVEFFTCPDPETCAEHLALYEETGTGPGTEEFFFFSHLEEDALSGVEQFTGWGEQDGTCSEPERAELLLVRNGDGTLTLSLESYIGESYPKDEDGYCTTTDAAAACEDAACTVSWDWILEPVE
jgi:hypothetical protein